MKLDSIDGLCIQPVGESCEECYACGSSAQGAGALLPTAPSGRPASVPEPELARLQGGICLRQWGTRHRCVIIIHMLASELPRPC